MHSIKNCFYDSSQVPLHVVIDSSCIFQKCNYLDIIPVGFKNVTSATLILFQKKIHTCASTYKQST